MSYIYEKTPFCQENNIPKANKFTPKSQFGVPSIENTPLICAYLIPTETYSSRHYLIS